MQLLIAFFAIMIALTGAVLLDDAFVRDWTKHWSGLPVDFTVINSKSIVAISDRSQLFNIDISGNDTTQNAPLNWKVDLRPFGSNQKMLVSTRTNKVYSYSSDINNVYVWDIKTGILERQFQVLSNPISVVNFFNNGALVLGLDGTIEYLPEDGTSTSKVIVQIPTPNIGTKLVTSFHNGILYLVSNSHAVGISAAGDFEVVVNVPHALGQVEQMSANIIVSEERKLFVIEDGLVKNMGKGLIETGNALLISPDYFIYHEGDELMFFNVIGTAAELIELPKELSNLNIISIEHVSPALSDFLVFSTFDEKFVIDITGLLSDHDPASMQVYKFPLGSSPVETVFNYLDYDINDNLTIVTVKSPKNTGEELTISTFSSKTQTSRENVFNSEIFGSLTGKYLIVDKLQSERTLDIAHHLLDEKHSGFEGSVLGKWLSRSTRHLSELGKFISTAVLTGKLPKSVESNEDVFGLEKFVIFFNSIDQKIIGVSTKNGEVLWKTSIKPTGDHVDTVQISDEKALVVFTNEVYELNLRNGEISDSKNDISSFKITNVLKISNSDDDYSIGLITEDKKIHFIDENKVVLEDDKYLVDGKSGTGYKLLASLKSLVPSWSLPLDGDEVILKFSQVNYEDKASSIGISLFDKSVLYKYLNPNIITIITSNTGKDSIGFYILDAITGSVLYHHSHQGEKIETDSIDITMDSNWIVYTYFALNPRPEQRIVVMDLFETGIPNERSNVGQESQSIFDGFNQTIGEVSTKSFIFPDRIDQISHTRTKFGITIKNIIALTDSGSIVQIPKFILNSRRIADREFTAQDAASDFRLSPYEPVISQGGKYYHVLNHKQQLLVGDNAQLLTKPTELESTSVVCAFGELDWFCTTVQPSLQYDTLGANFAKSKLLITILALLLAVVITKPIIATRKLNLTWIDRP